MPELAAKLTPLDDDAQWYFLTVFTEMREPNAADWLEYEPEPQAMPALADEAAARLLELLRGLSDTEICSAEHDFLKRVAASEEWDALLESDASIAALERLSEELSAEIDAGQTLPLFPIRKDD